MSKFSAFFSSTGSQVEVAYPTMKDMIADAAAGGYKPRKPKGQPFVHESKNGNKQFILANGAGDNKFIRISPNLDAELATGNPDIKLEEQPVYIGRALNDKQEQVGQFLVIGLSGLVTEEVDIKNMFNDYRPTPKGAKQ